MFYSLQSRVARPRCPESTVLPDPPHEPLQTWSLNLLNLQSQRLEPLRMYLLSLTQLIRLYLTLLSCPLDAGASKFRGKLLLDAVKNKEVTEQTIDASARRVLQLAKLSDRFENPDDKDEMYIDSPERDEIITRTAAEGTVLLKNNGNILPLKAGSKIVVIGQHTAVPTIMGASSAKVDIERSISPLTGLKEAGVIFDYQPGVPVFGAVPLPEPETITQTGNSGNPELLVKPIRLE